MAPPRKALIAVTSAHAPLYPGGKETGVFITEALHPFDVFKQAGFDVDLVSETGTYQPDWLSQQEDWLNGEDRETWEDESSEFRTKMEHLKRPVDVDPENVSYRNRRASKRDRRRDVIDLLDQYGIFFASAGHASLIDYPNAKGLQGVASDMYGQGGIVSAV